MGVGYWLWNLSDESAAAPPRPVQAEAPPTPTPPPQVAAATPPPSAPAATLSPAPSPVNLLFIPARRGDTLRTLYRAAYRAPRYRPPFEQLLAANPDLPADQPLTAGQLVALPGPLIDQ